ncbi:hypothetical protein EYR41_006866 [Orbilia oligospora]|uniref:Uncharacterized protein n=1 Tax=Orbilia oligospora TaxID=2813651 RepID=A0A8H2HN53_ORBOL|nr:hypothetical protein EYR41_006866 [Orbilia oligospora]
MWTISGKTKAMIHFSELSRDLYNSSRDWTNPRNPRKITITINIINVKSRYQVQRSPKTFVMSEAGPAPYKYVVANRNSESVSEERDRGGICYSTVDCLDDPTAEKPKQTYLHELYDYELKFVQDTIALINENEKQLHGTGYRYYFSGFSRVLRNSGFAYKPTTFMFYLKLGRPEVLRVSQAYEASRDSWDTSTGMHTPASSIS